MAVTATSRGQSRAEQCGERGRQPTSTGTGNVATNTRRSRERQLNGFDIRGIRNASSSLSALHRPLPIRHSLAHTDPANAESSNIEHETVRLTMLLMLCVGDGGGEG